MKTIPLTQGKVAIVDAADYLELNRHKWHYMNCGDRGGYASRVVLVDGKRRVLRMHTAILGLPVGTQADHRNHNQLDNRRSNLVRCTPSQNMQNRKLFKNNKSGHKNVRQRGDKYDVRIQVDGKSKYIGFFYSLAEAIKAASQARKIYHKEFAHE